MNGDQHVHDADEHVHDADEIPAAAELADTTGPPVADEPPRRRRAMIEWGPGGE